MDLTKYDHSFGYSNKVRRAFWNLSYYFLFRPFSLRIFRKYRNFVLRIFGATVSQHAQVYSSVKIWAPWNLSIDDYSTLGPNVDCYNQGQICIGKNTIISQKVYLCASSHDYEKVDHPLVLRPIIIKDQVWVAADSFIGPGVIINTGAVIGARSSVFKNIDSWNVVGGNPTTVIKKRFME